MLIQLYQLIYMPKQRSVRVASDRRIIFRFRLSPENTRFRRSSPHSHRRGIVTVWERCPAEFRPLVGSASHCCPVPRLPIKYPPRGWPVHRFLSHGDCSPAQVQFTKHGSTGVWTLPTARATRRWYGWCGDGGW
ncbi:hypothetical protein FGO68_gene4566 [Halteria grandinella]|uniref:Uncharacterized protein n=1 Tax=Halteria grandinella TaxID=5974 RepID=A0A8J8NAD8_HALGN|nr:hypothetical protein FGO68_gene4566 [Halteria grandinella]